MSNLLKGLDLFVVPRLHTSVEKYQINVWKSNGAKIKDRRTAVDSGSRDLYFIVNDLANTTKAREQVDKLQGSGAQRPFVHSEWIVESLKKNSLLPYKDYLYKEEPAPKKRKKATPKQAERRPGEVNKGLVSVATWKRDHKTVNRDLNSKITSQFQRMVDLLELEKLQDPQVEFKIMQYHRAINTIQTLDWPIRRGDDLDKAYRIGKSMQSHVQEILDTGTFEKLQTVETDVANDRELSILQEICGVHGFGPAVARKLVRQRDVTSVKQLEENPDEYGLTKGQRLGLKYRKDWAERMPRKEVEQIYQCVRDAIKSHPLEGSPEVKVAGSYLRGRETCGDIDMLMYIEGEEDPEVLHRVLFRLVKLLEGEGLITCELTEVRDDSNKFNGGCRLNNEAKCRRLDIIAVEWSRMGSAMIYFAGNDTFNRLLRQLAHGHKMKLNDAGLFMRTGELVESASEKRILDILEVGWVDYEDRNL